MTGPQGLCPWERALAPRALLTGCALSFLACCALGRLVSRQGPDQEFERFHPFINYLSLYYPTASQTRALARARLGPDRIAVVIGGSSVLHGAGQGAAHVWTKKLQALLGPRYRVLNFALHGTWPAEFAAVAAEVLEHDGRKVVFVTHVWAGTGRSAGEISGATHEYFFWDAYYKGLFSPGPEREARLAELARRRQDDESCAELRRRARLDGWLYYQDLWTTFSYRCASTVWCPWVAGSFTRPRRHYPDPDAGVPPDQRYPAGAGPTIMSWLAAWLPDGHAPGVAAGGPDTDYGGTPLVRSFQACFPEPARRRTLVLVNHLSPHYVNRLPADLRAKYAQDYPESVRALEQAGLAALELGRGYTDLDYNDHCHFSAEGAAKMAADVAPEVRRLARQLGYTE